MSPRFTRSCWSASGNFKSLTVARLLTATGRAAPWPTSGPAAAEEAAAGCTAPTAAACPDEEAVFPAPGGAAPWLFAAAAAWVADRAAPLPDEEEELLATPGAFAI